MIDTHWKGAPAAVEAYVAEQPLVLGPRVVAGVSYVTIRSAEAPPKTTGITAVPAELAAALLGVFVDSDPPAEPPKDIDAID